nr:hypothetical protein [Acidobacteriota bacterium]
QPGTVAVVRRSGTSSGGVAVYDDGAPRTATESQSTTIEFSASPLVLYGFNGDSTEFGFRKLAVGPCGLTTVATTANLMSGFSADFKVDNATAYSSSGRAFDPEAARIAGTFALVSSNSFLSTTPLVAPDAKAGRVYFLLNDGGFVLRVYDIKTFLKIGELRLPGVTGTASSLVRWGANGLAFRTSGGQLFLLQHALVGGTDPSFTPASTPAPPTFTAVGKVTTFGGGDAGGVTLSVSGSATATATTDSGGNFTITGLPPCGGFTVTPSKTNYVFSPASVTVASPASSTSLNFSATLKTVSFAQNALSVSEGVGKAVLTVTRNNSTGPASVSYETASGTASDRSDFNTTFGTLQFATGEASKTISILIDDDALVEGSETFNVTLKDPSGAALSPTGTSVTVTILDNDTSAPSANPLSDARFFVRRHYQDFLNRDAADDPSGFDFWSGQITACNALTDAQQKADCLEDHRLNVSAAFFLSIEFQQTGFLVHRFYTASYPDSPARPRGLPRFLEFLRDTQGMQRGVVVGQGDWQTQLEANKQAFALAFVQRPDFQAAHGAQDATTYVNSLFANAGVTPTDAERNAAISAFNNAGGGNAGRAAALRSVAESASVTNALKNEAFVLMQYFGYLRRNPDDPPDLNFDGYNFWLTKLNQFGGNYVAAEMVKAFLSA